MRCREIAIARPAGIFPDVAGDHGLAFVVQGGLPAAALLVPDGEVRPDLRVGAQPDDALAGGLAHAEVAGVAEAAVLERDAKSIRYRILSEDELRSSLQG